VSVGERSRDRNELIVSYLFLRRIVGWIGTLLPIVLLVGNGLFPGAPRPDSISGYYYTDMRNVFVGALCALGVFLVAYRGYDVADDVITDVAGLATIGVAFCPTKPAVCTGGTGVCPASSVARLSTSLEVVGDIHLLLAASALIALGLMALRFAKRGNTPPDLGLIDRLRYGLGFGAPAGDWQRRYRGETSIYRVSGLTVLGCVAAAALSNLLPASVKANWALLFIFESGAIFAFGVSWIVKGRAIQAIWDRVRHGRQARTCAPAPRELQGQR
jgi:hypothetical protein